MATPDQNKYIQFVNLFTKNKFFDNVCCAVVPPLLNCICTVSKQKEAFIYPLPNFENDIQYFWHSPSKVQRCFFSEDGQYLLLILTVNSLQIYKLDGEKVSLTIQIKASTLAKSLSSHNIDFSAANKVEPIKLNATDLIFVIDKKFIINIQWMLETVTVKYALAINNCLDISISDKHIFILVKNGHIVDGYNLLTGIKCHQELNACLANRSNKDVSVGYSFSKLCAHPNSKYLIVVNQDEEAVLFDITDLFDNYNTMKSLSQDNKKEKWKWRPKTKDFDTEAKIDSVKVIKKVSPPNGLVVSYLQPSFKGFFIFYSIFGMSKCVSYKVVDERTGAILLDFKGLVESEIVTGSCLPLIMSDSILSLCLGALINDYFIVKLCEIIPIFGFSRELERTLQSQQSDVDSDSHLFFLRMILKLYSNIFNSNLKNINFSESVTSTDDYSLKSSVLEKKEIERMDDLFRVVLEYNSEDDVEKHNIHQNMIMYTFLHGVSLLDTTYQATKSRPENELLSSLLKNLFLLYDRVQFLDPLSSEWNALKAMSDVEVVQGAVVQDTVALAYLFLLTNRNWPLENLETKFKETACSWIIELISMGELEKVKLILTNLGSDPMEYLKLLCLDTNEPIMRNLLANHLLALNQLNPDEIKVWKFCMKVEGALTSVIKRYHAFEHKMSVSLRDRIKIPTIKFAPYNGSIDLKTMLKYSDEWRNMVLTEVYFITGDTSLEKHLKKELCWQYMLQMNQINLLKNWIEIHCQPESIDYLLKTSDYLTKSFYTLFAKWPITEFMLDMVNTSSCMTTTKDAILDYCALYGLFSPNEKRILSCLIYRIENNSSLPLTRSIFNKPSSNVSIDEFDEMIFAKCSKSNLRSVIMTCLEDSKLVKDPKLMEEHPWLDCWNHFKNWDQNISDKKLMVEAIKKSAKIFPLSAKEEPYLDIALALIEEREISDIILEKGEECNLLKLPLVEIGWKTSQDTNNRKPDVSLYDLLQCSKVPIDKLFVWQSQNKVGCGNASNDVILEFPNFSRSELCTKYGYKQDLDYIYYLKQGRPSFACNLFIVETLKNHRRLTAKMIRRTCGVVHGLALRHWRNKTIGNACLAFILMLGDMISANILRIHLASIETIENNLSEEETNFISTLVHGIASKDVAYIQEMASLLEKSVMKLIENEKPISQLQKWTLPVSFCNAHDIPLPTMYPRYLAENSNWIFFILCLDIFRYPYEQAIELIENIESKILKSHLIRALTRTTLKFSTTSPNKAPPKILLEPESTGKDDSQVVNTKDSKDIFQSFVSNIYTEVLNTIQTFTDKNIILPWSCEQDPDTDVLLTLLKCENESDTSKSLLISSIELQSPVLAVLATCFQSENVFPNLIAWFVSAIPLSMSQTKRREEGQHLVEKFYGPKEIEYLLIDFFSTGYFQTFYRGMYLFMSENPLTLFVSAIYQAFVVLHFDASLETLKDFVLEMNHFRVKESPLLSKSSILNIVAQLIENVLTRPDILNSVKRRFLRILADSDLKAVDSSFPNYLLWYQISEILESSEVNLDFIQLYDITAISEELEDYLNSLVENYQFTQALEICSLLSLNKDKLVIAMWAHQLEVLLKNECDDYKLWSDSSAAFKDENVNPKMTADFYYEMASRFQSSTVSGLRNRYLALDFCLNWRKCIEDTSSPSFREESDMIELEKWKCCIEPEFDISVLKSSAHIDVSYSLLVNLWTCSKVLVRSQILNESEKERVEVLINMFLDQGDLYRALRLNAFFKSTNQDLLIITSSLRVIQGEITLAELTKLSITFASTPIKLCPSMKFNDLDLTDYEIVPSKKQEQILTFLNKFCQNVTHGKRLMNKILLCYRLSVYLDLTFTDIASERDYLTFLSRSSSMECLNKLNIVSDLINLADLQGVELAKFLKDKIVCAVSEFYASGLIVPIKLWGVSLDSEFHLIINLIENPSLLGLELLNASFILPCNEAVEVLIRSHDCYTSCCNVEGIGHVLRSARILAAKALQEEQWQYLVRLLVGIGRYTDMSYGFQMLKDNHQFEHLLRKKLQKTPGLHVAISEFLQRYCPEDKELAKMVSAHYGLHAKHAALWQEEADEILAKLSIVDNCLKDSGKVRQALNTALDNYSHAAQLFLEAGKLNRALKVSYKAQIIALQISLLGGPAIIAIQSQSQLQNLVNDCLSVAQTMIISRAYELEPDWVTALHERWVLKGDKTFFSDLKSSGILSLQLRSLYSYKYDLGQLTNNKAKERMKQLTVPAIQKPSAYVKDMKKMV